MASQQQCEFITLLHQWAVNHWKEAEIVERGDLLTLRMMPSLYTDGTAPVLMEICLLEYSDDISVVQIYTTIFPKPEPGLAELRAKLPEWNFTSLAGAYGIYEQQGQLYHKQNVAVITGAGADEQIDTVLPAICMAMDEMARRLPEALELSSGFGNTPDQK